MSQTAPQEPMPDEVPGDTSAVIEITPLPPLEGDPAMWRERLLAGIGRRRDDRAYLDRLEEGAADYRRAIEEQEAAESGSAK